MPCKCRVRHTLSGPCVTYGTTYFISTRVASFEIKSLIKIKFVKLIVKQSQMTNVIQDNEIQIFGRTNANIKLGTQVFSSIVVSIPACHAGDRGSIPRWRDFFFFFLFVYLIN